MKSISSPAPASVRNRVMRTAVSGRYSCRVANASPAGRVRRCPPRRWSSSAPNSYETTLALPVGRVPPGRGCDGRRGGSASGQREPDDDLPVVDLPGALEAELPIEGPRFALARLVPRRSEVSGSGGDVPQIRVGEETADEVGQFLQPVQRGHGLGLEVVGSGDTGAADAVGLDVLPDPLVRVEFRGVAGQQEQP